MGRIATYALLYRLLYFKYMELRLVLPEEKYFKSYVSALEEFKTTSLFPEHFRMEIENFPEAVVRTTREEQSGDVPRRTYWLVNESGYVGMVQLRLVAEARYPNIKSNIYYEVRPSLRNQGYGTLALACGIEQARQLGMKNLIISCDSTNLPSKKIIENSGANFVRDEKVPDRKEPVLIYELQL